MKIYRIEHHWAAGEEPAEYHIQTDKELSPGLIAFELGLEYEPVKGERIEWEELQVKIF